jgi:hypothetical protein
VPSLPAPGGYNRRVVDDELDTLFQSLPAISIEGAKAVGKTATASQRAHTIYELDDPEQRSVAQADPARLLEGTRPVLIDEWQRVPGSWDLVRRAVDQRGAQPASFLLTGSASLPPDATTHSGAGRIVTLRMRPLTLVERGVETPTVSLAQLLNGTRPPLNGQTRVRLETYAQEILDAIVITTGSQAYRRADGIGVVPAALFGA